MYTRSAQFYDQLYDFKNYPEACAQLHRLVQELRPDARSLLDVACSTGKHLEVLRANYDVQGLDINEDLLEIARQRCPGVRFHAGTMIDFDLGQQFDVVTCLFSSIAYVKTPEKLASTFRSFSRHMKPGGLLLVEPWVSPEQYWERNIVLNVSKSTDLKIAWMYVGKREGNLVTNDISYLVGTPDGVFPLSERHEMGLFGGSDYLQAIKDAGLRLLKDDEKGFFGNGLYVVERPHAESAP
jgi:SAM-dependent methyltransferase